MQEQIKAILAIGFDRVSKKSSLTSREKKLILNTYRDVTGIKKRMGCGTCLIEVYLYFKQLTNKNQTIMESKFRLKEGKRLMMHGSDDVITNANITDEKMLFVLKRTPGVINLCVAYPENWRELVDKFDPISNMRKNKAEEKKEVKPVAAQVIDEDLEETANEARRQNLLEKTHDELKEFATALEFPKSEWSKLKKGPFIEYLLEKTK